MRDGGIHPSMRFAGGALVAALLLGLLLWHAEPQKVLEALGDARPGWVAAVFGVHLLGLLLRVRRWRILLDASDCSPPPQSPPNLVADSVFFGWLGNLVLPARVGELARPAMYSRRSGVPFAQVLGTSVVERIADILVVAGSAWLVLSLLPIPESLPAEFTLGARWLGAGSLVAVAALVLLARRRSEPGDTPPGLVGRFREGLSSLRKPGASVRIIGGTVLIWGVEALCVYGTFIAFDVEPSWTAAICHVVAVTLSIAVVSVPAGLGVEQGVTIVLFAAWGIDEASALAMSLVLSLAAVFWVVPGGLLAMWRQGGKLGEAGGPEATAQADQDGSEPGG